MRPSLEELAEARCKAQRFLATVPGHSMASTLRTFLEVTAPVTKEEALPVMIANANEAGDWPPGGSDPAHARDAFLKKDDRGNWQNSIRAQWATLRHFMGGGE